MLEPVFRCVLSWHALVLMRNLDTNSVNLR